MNTMHVLEWAWRVERGGWLFAPMTAQEYIEAGMPMSLSDVAEVEMERQNLEAKCEAFAAIASAKGEQ
jgi:hypothetical protein